MNGQTAAKQPVRARVSALTSVLDKGDGAVYTYVTLQVEALNLTDQKTERTMNATEDDLDRFTHRNRRGKIIMWHGWEDPAISAAELPFAAIRSATRASAGRRASASRSSSWLSA